MIDEISLKELFLLFFKIGGMTLGGGYVMMPLMQDEIVENRAWISSEDFIDILAVAQSFPGALAVNVAIYVGYKLRGKKGAFATCLGVILPPFLIILIASAFLLKYRDMKIIQGFFSGVRPAVTALIAVAVIKLSKNVDKNFITLVIAIASFVAIAIIKIHPAFVIIASGVFGILYFKDRKEGIDEDSN